MLRATTPCTLCTSQLAKVLRQWSVLNTLASKCASRHSHVHFLNSSTCKSAPTMKRFEHFGFEMCPAPQLRALFEQLPKVLQQWSVLNTLASTCASRHSHVHFLNSSTSKSAPTMKRFEHFGFEMCLAPQPRTLFEQLNFQKCSNEVLFAF